MCKQPVPRVTDKDVKRVALRDFGESQFSEVIAILDEFGKQEWNHPSARVRLAILKLADGDLNKLMENTAVAIKDFRDVLAAAEYPGYSRKIAFNEVDKDYKHAVIGDDWKQYRQWLERE
jgi:hypothetical protein